MTPCIGAALNRFPYGVYNGRSSGDGSSVFIYWNNHLIEYLLPPMLVNAFGNGPSGGGTRDDICDGIVVGRAIIPDCNDDSVVLIVFDSVISVCATGDVLFDTGS